MLKNNESVFWQPKSTGDGRFKNWLEGLNDWNLSRSRFWGTPIPIWKTKDEKDRLYDFSQKTSNAETNLNKKVA